MNIIFDLDGTLWNPSNTILNAWSNVLSNQNINVNLEDIKNLLGLSNKDIINWFVCNKKISEDKATIILNECQEMEISFILHDGWDLFDGVKETLKRLSVANNLYIVSNCQAGYIEAFLEFYKLDKYFKDYECSGNTNKDKEYNINLIIKRNDLKNSIYVGDTVGDFIASHSCGIPFIYANYGFGKSNEFDYKINGFSDLLKLCYNLKGRRKMEKRDLYDENKKKTGETIEKGQPIPTGRYYITVVVWMQNSKGEFLIQKTVPEKYHMWSTTGGHPKVGESSLQGIVTEIKEELGITVRQDELKLFKTIKTDDDFVDIYYLKSDIDINDITVQPDEVEKVKWATIEEINKLIDEGDFLPPHIEFFRYCLEYLDKK